MLGPLTPGNTCALWYLGLQAQCITMEQLLVLSQVPLRILDTHILRTVHGLGNPIGQPMICTLDTLMSSEYTTEPSQQQRSQPSTTSAATRTPPCFHSRALPPAAPEPTDTALLLAHPSAVVREHTSRKGPPSRVNSVWQEPTATATPRRVLCVLQIRTAALGPGCARRVQQTQDHLLGRKGVLHPLGITLDLGPSSRPLV